MTCRECWEPTPEGKELCAWCAAWCAMTPEQQRRRLWLDFVALVISVAVLMSIVVYSAMNL